MNVFLRAARKAKRTIFPSAAAPPSGPNLIFQSPEVPAKWYMHELGAYTPSDDMFSFRADSPSADFDLIIERLVDYNRHLEESVSQGGVSENKDMWLLLTKQHEPFRALLRSGDVKAIGQALLDIAKGDLVAGFMNYQPYVRLKDSPIMRLIEGKHFVDKVLSLADALGCQSLQGVEQGERGFAEVDIRGILEAARAKVGFDITAPAAGGGSFGYFSDGRVLTMRDVTAIYTAYQATELSRGFKSRTVGEIGGGTGSLAYFLFNAGFERISVFDLPTVSLVQAYFLMRSVGTTNVWLDGEKASDARIRILPFWKMAVEPDKSFSLVINQDSMPEIQRDAALDYFRIIKLKAARFLSINQEGRGKDHFSNPQSVVFELVESSGGFRRIQRFPYWMRPGYVQECYDVLPLS